MADIEVMKVMQAILEAEIRTAKQIEKMIAILKVLTDRVCYLDDLIHRGMQ